MKKVAIFGSRTGVDPLHVGNEMVRVLEEYGRFIVVTTEAVGVCEAAKVAGLALHLPVIRFAPIQTIGGVTVEHQFQVEEWRMLPGNHSVVRDQTGWADWQSALLFRSLLMVDRADLGIAFHHDNSRGTQFEIELFAGHGKPCRVIKS